MREESLDLMLNHLITFSGPLIPVEFMECMSGTNQRISGTYH